MLDDDEDNFGSHFNEAAGAAAAANQEELEVSEDDFGCDKTMRNSFQEYVLTRCNLQQQRPPLSSYCLHYAKPKLS